MQGTNFNTKIQLQPEVSLAGLTGPPISEFLARRVFFPESGTYVLLCVCYIFLMLPQSYALILCGQKFVKAFKEFNESHRST